MPDSSDQRYQRLKPRQITLSLFAKTKTGEKIISNQRYRMILSAAIAFVFNLLYALYYCVLGVINLSLWFITMCAFYGILATVRFSAVLCERKKQDVVSYDTEKFVMKLSGILLTALSILLAVMNYLSLSQSIAVKYGEIIMITIATYTFYKITMAVIRNARQRQNPSPLLRTLRSISYAEIAASVLTLQRSMLVSFGTMGSRQIYLMNAITGAVVCLFVWILGLSMIAKSKRKENESWQNQNL